MAKDGLNINVTGVGSAMGGGQAGRIDTSSIQDSLNKVADNLKKLDTTNFQKNLTQLSSGLQKSATAATNFVESMQKAEAKISGSLKEGLSPNKSTNYPENIAERVNAKKSPLEGNYNNPDKFTKSIDSLSDSVEKLASNIKKGGGGGNEGSPPEKSEPGSGGFTENFKKLLAAVGIGSIIKQVSENENLMPNRAAGGLINSNVVGNTQAAGNDLLASYQNRIASNTGIISGGIGAGVGALAGSVIPGVGTLIGAGLGYAAGSGIGGSIGQNKTATELPTLQRSLTTDYYSNLSHQIPQLNQFAQSQYGTKGFEGSEAFQDPYFESKAALGRSYSRFAGGTLNSDTTSNILKSLTAQGNSSPQELNITGNLLGQIARFTGKTSGDIEKVYKSVEKSGLNPNEGLQKTLSLLQSGLSVRESENIIQRTSQRTEAFASGQQSYFGASPFQQFSAQQVGKAANFDVEKFYQGNEQQAKQLQELSRQANEELRSGRIGTASTRLQMLESIGITPAQGDVNKQARGVVGKEFITPSKTQDAILRTTQEAITKGAKGRDSSEIVNETLSEIGKSTKSFSALSDATDSLIDTFKSAASSFAGYVLNNSPVTIKPNKPVVQHPGGR